MLTDLIRVKQHLHIVLNSFGVKSGLMFPKADLYLDCRTCADPSLAGMGSGDDPTVQAYVRAASNLTPFWELMTDSFTRLTTRRGAGKEFEREFTIVTMCAWGIHRSRAMKHILASTLRVAGYQHVEVE